MRPHKKIHGRASDHGSGHAESLRVGITDSGFYAGGLNRVATCWCGEGMSPNKSLCTECYSRVPDGIQKALYNRGHFIDSHWQVVKRAIEWLKENPKEAA